MNDMTCTLIGSLLDSSRSADGQTIKTKILYDELLNKGLFDKLEFLNLADYKRNKIRLLLKVIHAYIHSDCIIFSVSRNGMRILYPFFYSLSHIWKRHIIQVVIGGGLPQRTADHPKWVRYLNAFDRNYVELQEMQKNLELLGVNNVEVIPNFKRSSVVPIVLTKHNDQPKKLCTFSRVSEEKGILDAIHAVIGVNQRMKKTAYTLTIYGKIDTAFEDRFKEIEKSFPEYIHYGGIIQTENSAKVLSDYYLLLFPTYHPGEGFPGTILDAYAAGLPVLASRWHYNASLISPDETGDLFEPRNVDELISLLEKYYNKEDEINSMRSKCQEKTAAYLPEKALSPLFSYVERIEKK